MASDEAPQDEVGDSEELESEVSELSEKILRYRATLPEKLNNSFASLIAAQRPVIPEALESETCRDPSTGQVAANVAVERDEETSKKIQLLKEKISSNASAMPIVLKRMRECISRIDKLESQHLTIHPAFKRKKTS